MTAEKKEVVGSTPTLEHPYLSDAQCDDVIAFLEDYEWSGLSRDNVRTWDRAIADARITQETSGDGRGPNGECPVCGEVGACKPGCADGTDGPL